jgi:hypothetical protein
MRITARCSTKFGFVGESGRVWRNANFDDRLSAGAIGQIGIPSTARCDATNRRCHEALKYNLQHLHVSVKSILKTLCLPIPPVPAYHATAPPRGENRRITPNVINGGVWV